MFRIGDLVDIEGNGGTEGTITERNGRTYVILTTIEKKERHEPSTALELIEGVEISLLKKIEELADRLDKLESEGEA